jgi:hypothetical protein
LKKLLKNLRQQHYITVPEFALESPNSRKRDSVS